MRITRNRFNVLNFPEVETVYGQLLQAVVDQNLKTVTLLIEQGNANTKPTIEDIYKYSQYESPFHYAAAAGSIAILRALLKAKDADLNQQGDYHCRPLHKAIGHPRTVQFLVKNGADVNVQTAFGETPLHRAISTGQIETAKYLVDKGANPLLSDSLTGSPLQMAEGKCDSLLVTYRNEALAQRMRTALDKRSQKTPVSADCMFFSKRAGMHSDISDKDMAASCFGLSRRSEAVNK